MPFKTRRQKEAAASRRLTYVKKALVTDYKTQIEKNENDKEEKSDNLPKREPRTNTPEKDYSYVKRDLLKIAALCALIIGFQIIFRLFYERFPLHLVNIL